MLMMMMMMVMIRMRMMMMMLVGGLFWKTGNRNRLRAGVIFVQAVRRYACGLGHLLLPVSCVKCFVVVPVV